MTEADISRGWAVRVTGTPAPKGSMRCVGRRGKRLHVLVEDNSKTKPWRSRVEEAGRVLPVTGLVGPLGCEITITIERPATVPLRVRAWPMVNRSRGTGDVDKLARTVLDGLEDAGVFGDDAQVVELVIRKCYPDSPYTPDQLDRPGAVIRLWPYGEDT